MKRCRGAVGSVEEFLTALLVSTNYIAATNYTAEKTRITIPPIPTKSKQIQQHQSLQHLSMLLLFIVNGIWKLSQICIHTKHLVFCARYYEKNRIQSNGTEKSPIITTHNSQHNIPTEYVIVVNIVSFIHELDPLSKMNPIEHKKMIKELPTPNKTKSSSKNVQVQLTKPPKPTQNNALPTKNKKYNRYSEFDQNRNWNQHRHQHQDTINLTITILISHHLRHSLQIPMQFQYINNCPIHISLRYKCLCC